MDVSELIMFSIVVIVPSFLIMPLQNSILSFMLNSASIDFKGGNIIVGSVGAF